MYLSQNRAKYFKIKIENNINIAIQLVKVIQGHVFWGQ